MTIAHQDKRQVAGDDTTDRRTIPILSGAAVCAGLLVAAAALPARAENWGEGNAAGVTALSADSFANETTRLSDEELRGLRGGMMINGVDFDFGAIVRIHVDGLLVAQTTLNLNPNGSISRTSEIHGSNTSQFTNPSQLNGSNLHFGNLNGADGFVITGSNGTSLALNSIKPGDMASLLANDAVGRSITQTVEVNVTINNFSQINANLQNSMAIGRAISAAIPSPMLAH